MPDKTLLARLWVIYPHAWIDFILEPRFLTPIPEDITDGSDKTVDFLQERFRECCDKFLQENRKYQGRIIDIEKFPYDDGYGFSAYLI
jgi:hypothetical protein